MGFFKWLGRKAGEAIESVGDLVGSSTLQKFGRNIQNACAEKIGSEQSYEYLILTQQNA